MEITLWVTTGNCRPIKVRGVLSSVATYQKSSNSIPGLWTGCWNLSTIRGIPIRKAKMWGFTRRSAKLDRDQPYSWIKTPRYKGMPMETGPLARNIVGHASGNEAYKEITQRCLKQLNVPYEAMYSTAGRTLARAIEANLLADWQTEFYTALLQNIKNGDYRMFNGIKWEPDTWPEAAQGVGLTEGCTGPLCRH